MTKQDFFHQAGKRFFFNDAATVAAYIKENCPEQAEGIVKAADDVARQVFLFNLRWDMERTHEPVVFENEIDWLHQPGDDPEWVYAFNRMRFWIVLGQAYALTGNEKYAEAFVRQLRGWVSTCRQDDPACGKAWRSIEVGLRLEYWLKAIRYFEKSEAVTDDVVALFCQSVAGQAEFIMEIWNPYNLMSNWGVLANHGLFMAGVMLPQSARTAEYAAEALRRLNAEQKMQVFRDGMQWEQSPMYHNEVLHCYLDVVLLAQRCEIALPDEMLRATHAMCRVDAFGAKPNGNEVSMGDSDDIDQRDLISKGALLFGDGELKFCGYEKPDFDTAWDIGEAGIAAYAALPATKPTVTDKALWDSGNFFARGGWGGQDTWLHLACGTLGAGHGHADKLHLDLFSRGEDVLVDAGRYTYVFGPERVRYKEAAAHNTITVDGADFYPCVDSWECSGKLSRAVNQKFYSEPRYAYLEGAHLAYANLPEGGVTVNRRIIYLKPDIIVVADELYTGAAHSYQSYWHWNNAGTLTGGGGSWRYQSQRVSAQMQILAPGLATTVADSRISRQYNKWEPNKALRAEYTGNGFASCFTVIALGDADCRDTLTVEKLPVFSSFKGHQFTDDRVEALNIRCGSAFYTVAVAHTEFASPTDTFNADGCIGYGNAVVFDRAAGETEIGTVLLW